MTSERGKLREAFLTPERGQLPIGERTSVQAKGLRHEGVCFCDRGKANVAVVVGAMTVWREMFNSLLQWHKNQNPRAGVRKPSAAGPLHPASYFHNGSLEKSQAHAFTYRFWLLLSCSSSWSARLFTDKFAGLYTRVQTKLELTAWKLKRSGLLEAQNWPVQLASD